MSDIVGSLTICRKAGKLKLGYALAAEACRNAEAKAVLAAEDVSEKTLKEIRYVCAKSKTGLYALGMTKSSVGKALGTAAGIIAVCDEGFAGKMRKLLAEIDCGADADRSDSYGNSKREDK